MQSSKTEGQAPYSWHPQVLSPNLMPYHWNCCQEFIIVTQICLFEIDCLIAEYAKNMTDTLYQFVHIAWYWVLLVMSIINCQIVPCITFLDFTMTIMVKWYRTFQQYKDTCSVMLVGKHDRILKLVWCKSFKPVYPTTAPKPYSNTNSRGTNTLCLISWLSCSIILVHWSVWCKTSTVG